MAAGQRAPLHLLFTLLLTAAAAWGPCCLAQLEFNSVGVVHGAILGIPGGSYLTLQLEGNGWVSGCPALVHQL